MTETKNIKLSCIIPSYKDPLLHKTIDSLLENALGDIEIIPVLDGYWPDPQIKDDPRIKVVHLGRNRGMREAINAGVAVARGEYIMRTDEHCMFAKGYDVVLTRDCRRNWIMTPRRYFLDPVKWEVMDIPPIDYEKLVIQNVSKGVQKFAGRNWKSRTKKNAHKMIDQNSSIQGSAWVMKRSWWNKVIKELDTENYGPLIQDSHEMIFKTWKAGGKLVLNKNTWYAHKHRKFPRCHNNGTKENPANCDAGYAYALKTWRKYYEEVIRPRFNI